MKLLLTYRRSFLTPLLIITGLFVSLFVLNQNVYGQRECPPAQRTEVAKPMTRCLILDSLKQETIINKKGEEKQVPIELRNALLIDLITKRGIAFVLTPNVETQFVEAGASPALINVIKKAWAKISNQPDYLLTVGDDYRYQKNFEEAIENYDKAIELNPTGGQIFNNRGLAYKELGLQYRALWNKIKNENPEEAAKHFEESNKYYDKAIEDFTRAISLEENVPTRLLNRGISFYEKPANNPEQAKTNGKKAIDDFTKAIFLNPDYREAYENRAMTYRYLFGDKENAILDYQKCMELGGCRGESIRNYISVSKPN